MLKDLAVANLSGSLVKPWWTRRSAQPPVDAMRSADDHLLAVSSSRAHPLFLPLSTRHRLSNSTFPCVAWLRSPLPNPRQFVYHCNHHQRYHPLFSSSRWASASCESAAPRASNFAFASVQSLRGVCNLPEDRLTAKDGRKDSAVGPRS